MTTRRIERKDPAMLRSDFPIADRIDGWFFRQREVSNGCWVVEGSDLWGRTVSRQGGYPDVVLAECVADAKELQAQIDDAL